MNPEDPGEALNKGEGERDARGDIMAMLSSPGRSVNPEDPGEALDRGDPAGKVDGE